MFQCAFNLTVYNLTGNLLMYCLTREPGMIERYSFFVDTFHHKGHTNCSPFLAHKSDPLTHFRNSSTNEVKNRLHKYMKRVAAFLNQARFLVLFRHIAYLINQVQLAMNQIIDLGGRASGTAKLVVDKSNVQTLVCDGVMVNLSAKHVRTGNRPHSVTPRDSLRRVKNLISCNERLIISDAKARNGLRELLKTPTIKKNEVLVKAFKEWLEDEGSFLSEFVVVGEVMCGILN